MGEFDLIAGVISRLAQHQPLPSDVLVGPGDDAAVLAVGSEHIVFTTDIAVEGVHFRRDWSSLRQIGAKIAAANCADCEAMGATTTTLVVALAGAVDQEMANELADGIAEEAQRAGAVVVGGDMSIANQLVISIAAIGRLNGRSPVVRSGAQVGDEVVLLGHTGRSAAGLALLTAGRSDVGADLIADYHSPRPPYGGGPLLADAGAHAMCDVSDGLLADLGHIAKASGVRIEINPDQVDLTELIPAAAELGVDPLRWALTGGEDHALVATLPAGSLLPEGSVTIGRVEQGQGVKVIGIDVDRWTPGWEHFTG
jgi:thiamine-monophosphate kinase